MNGIALAVTYKVINKVVDKIMTVALNKHAAPLQIPYAIEKKFSKSQKLKIKKWYRTKYKGNPVMTQKSFAAKINKSFRTNKSLSTIIRIAKG